MNATAVETVLNLLCDNILFYHIQVAWLLYSYSKLNDAVLGISHLHFTPPQGSPCKSLGTARGWDEVEDGGSGEGGRWGGGGGRLAWRENWGTLETNFFSGGWWGTGRAEDGGRPLGRTAMGRRLGRKGMRRKESGFETVNRDNISAGT